MQDEIPSAAARSAIIEVLDGLAILAQRFQLYGARHPRTQERLEAWDEAVAKVRELVPAEKDALAIACHGGRFYLENTPLGPEGSQAHALRELLERLGMAGFVLSLAISRESLEEVLRHLTKSKRRAGAGEPDESLPDGFRWIEERELHRIQAAAAPLPPPRSAHVLLGISQIPVDDVLYNDAMTVLDRFFTDCAEGRPADIGPVRDVARRLATAVRTEPQRILPRASVPYYGDYLIYHSINVCLHATAAACLVVDDPEQLEIVAMAALLHDLGQALLPPEILYKASGLLPQQLDRIVSHPRDGVTVLHRVRDVHPFILAAAYGHHIRSVSHGYPQVEAAYPLGTVTRLVGVADTFESLAAHRPYRMAMTPPEAFVCMYEDPELAELRPFVQLLARAIGFHPIGSRVRTQGGRLAIVCGHRDGDPARPVIRRLRLDGGGGGELGSLEEDAVCGDLPWIRPPRSAKVVIHAVDPLHDLDLLGRAVVTS